MKDFIAWALPTLGCTLIITCSALFRRFREFWEGRWPWFYSLVTCPMCTGFWVGGSFSALCGVRSPLVLFFEACASSYLCWASHVALCKLGQGELLSARPDLKKGNET